MALYENLNKDEIVREYLQAKNPDRQVKILAQLNACPVEKIKEILRESGKCGTLPTDKKVGQKPQNTAKPKKVEDAKMVEAISNDIKKRICMAESVSGGCMDTDTMYEVIKKIHEAFPNTPLLSKDGGGVKSVELVVRYGVDGSVIETKATLN